MVQVLEFSFKL